MIYLKCLCLVLMAAVHHGSSLDTEYSSLSCLLEEKNDTCLIPKDQQSLENLSVLSPDLVYDFSNLHVNLKTALINQNFQNLEDYMFDEVPSGMILLFPVCRLSELNGSILGYLVNKWQNNEVVVKHLVKAFLYSSHFDAFSNMLQNVDFSDDTLKWIAEVASFSDRDEARTIMGRLPLLFYSPPESILLYRRPERFFLLSFWDHPEDKKLFSINKPFLRFWAYTMIVDQFLEPLENWNNFYIDRWGFFLTGATTDELNHLNIDNVDDLQKLFNFNFSSIQVRSLFDKFYSNKALTQKDFHVLSHSVLYLLPEQINSFPLEIGSYFEQYEIPSDCGYTSLRQILEVIRANCFLQFECRKFNYPNTKFVSVLPRVDFQKYFNRPLNVTDYIKLNSELQEKSQHRHNLFNLNMEAYLKYSQYFQVFSARDIMLNSPCNVSHYILSNVDSTNVPQSFAALNKVWTEIGSSSIFRSILDNPKSRLILEKIPSRHIKFDNKLLQTIETVDYRKLPEAFIASITKQLKETSLNFKYLNVNESLSFILTGISCEDVYLMDPYNFILFLSKYNKYKQISNKIMPKNLQNCCIHKLLEVLEMKSYLRLNTPHFSKVSLLNEAEVDAIGGYVLSALPIPAVRKSRLVRPIIKAIGKLSVWELLSAASSITHLQNLSSILAQTINPVEKISFSLFDFGNLTLFLESNYIQKINREYFKLFLEGDYIDHRLCATNSTRSSWYSLIKNIFGTPDKWTYQTLFTLSDFLIVVPLDDMLKINSEAWVYAADTLITKYFDSEFDSNFQYYQVCLRKLDQEEKLLYIEDLKKVVNMLINAAQLQINSIASAETLVGNSEYTSGEIFTSIDSEEEIKLPVPWAGTTTEEEYLTNTKTTNSYPFPTGQAKRNGTSHESLPSISANSTVFQYEDNREFTTQGLPPSTFKIENDSFPIPSKIISNEKKSIPGRNYTTSDNHSFTMNFMKHSEINDYHYSERKFPKDIEIGYDDIVEMNKYNISQVPSGKVDYLKINISYSSNETRATEIRKRSTEKLKWSCEALKMVGRSIEIIMSERVVEEMTDEDLLNCIDLFSDLKLNREIKGLIWKRIKKGNLINGGTLVSESDLEEMKSINFSLSSKWALEIIFLLGKYNSKPEVINYVANEVWKNNGKPFPVEMVVSLGSMICDLPFINSTVISPAVLLKASVILGKSLPCNHTCLSKIADIVVDKDAFNDPSTWSYLDVHDLSIIVAGLRTSGWKRLIERNHAAIAGITEAAFNCLPYNYIKMMKKIPIDILPKVISHRFSGDHTEEKLHNFEFFSRTIPIEHISYAGSKTFNLWVLIISMTIIFLISTI